ncbi:hypothetical protein [Gimesia sp.]|uniref:hypothetical protein n=1 Tax=Gimesia sp. TaxID=2024833 RepID=UPI000C4094E5|nr:hypothetical protein [Gimesia sp.]MAX40381.1 hypothetical protein [Gimesia sp.]HBL43134.1 hypothetical protein [Planctomycetaceae bacterium]|tara:strand:- start:677 stop:970 length:294 start_codon:yes stop_codon:yes gene_type:complete
MRIASQFWMDEIGSVSPFATVLLMTILLLGLLPGVVTLRDQIVQEFGDVAVAIESFDQSYSYSFNGVTSEYIDSSSISDPVNEAPAGLDLTISATSE